jgi:outer membrane immunogenic protein
MKRIILIAVLLLLASAANANAAFYVGASWLSIDADPEQAFDNFETDDSSFKAYAGFTFMKYLGIEASYRDLGTHTVTVGPTTTATDLEALDISALARFSMGRVTLFGKVGYANISQDITIDNGLDIITGDNDDWELMYGVGIDVRILPHLGVRGEWEEFDLDANLNTFSAGVWFKF